VDTNEIIPLYITSINTSVIAPVCMHFLNMCDIILVGNNILMSLS